MNQFRFKFHRCSLRETKPGPCHASNFQLRHLLMELEVNTRFQCVRLGKTRENKPVPFITSFGTGEMKKNETNDGENRNGETVRRPPSSLSKSRHYQIRLRVSSERVFIIFSFCLFVRVCVRQPISRCERYEIRLPAIL